MIKIFLYTGNSDQTLWHVDTLTRPVFFGKVALSLLAIFLGSTPAGPAWAQTEEVAALPTVTVTGSLTPDDLARERLEQAREEMAYRAGGTSVVDAKDYRDGRAGNMADVMSYAPGVYAQTRHGEETRFSIRGSGIQRGFVLRGIYLYQDGIPLSHADGAGDFQSIDPLAAEYVESWRGANALEFGGNSLGGAVNFVTPTGWTAPHVVLRAQTGSYGQSQSHASFAGANERLDGFLSLSHSEQDGHRDHARTRATRFSGNVGLMFNSAWYARLYLTHIDSKLQLPGALTRSAMRADRHQSAPGYAELDADNNYRMSRAALKLEWTPTDKVKWISSIYLANRDRLHSMAYGILDQQSIDTGMDSRGILNLSKGALTRRLVVGASFMKHRADERSYANLNGKAGRQTRDNVLIGRQYTLYGEYSHELVESWTLQVGAQAVYAGRDLRNLFAPSNSYSKHFTGVSPKLGLIYNYSENSQIYANLSRSLEAPPFGELVVRPAYPLASDQKATTLELGYRFRDGDSWVDAAIYRSRLHGELLSLNDANGVALGTVNADRTIHQGIELGMQIPLYTHATGRFNYLFNDFRFNHDSVYGKNRLAGIAPHVLRAEIEWKISPYLFMTPSIEWLPGNTKIDHANTLSQGGYALFGLTVGGKMARNLRWFVEGRNLTNRKYVAGTAAQANVQGRDGAYYFPGDGRAFYAGLEWRL